MSASKKTRRQPALWTALGFGIGIFLGRTVEIGLAAAAVLSGLALLCSAAGFYRKAHWTGWMVWVVVVLLGALRYHIDTALSPLPHLVALEVFGQRGVVTGHIVQEPERSDERVHFAIELEQVVTDSAIYHLSGQVLVTVKDAYLPADYGDRVSLRGRLQRPRAVRNPGAFDYRAFLAQQDIYGTLFVGKPEQIVSVERLPGHWLYEGVVLPLRRAVRQSIERNLSGAPAGLLLGVLLGEKRRIPEEVRAAFRSTGLAHALVVSGLHVGMVGGFFFFGFRLLRLADRSSSAATIAALTLYALVTGAQVPVVRAVLMGVVVLLGRVLRRQGDIYNTLGLAALAILVIWPESPWSLSFQLSFGATWAIVALHGPLAALFPTNGQVGRWVVGPLCASLAAQLGTGPLIAYSFQQLALGAVVANLAVVPLLALAVGLGLLAALTGWILPWIATAFNATNYLVLVGLLELVSWWASLPFASVAVPRPGVLFVAVAAALCLLGPLLPHRPWACKAAIFASLVWLNVAVWTYALRSRDLE
ncbi:MAG: ComEC/Rec2 family competence protein, partial [Gemmatimonadota bacterium]|nr:ComEC/Rec2 family competence protein [Gemmatimonadota bacterium]